MRKLHAFDLVVFGYIAIVSTIVVVARPPGAWIYLAYHTAVAGMVAMIILAYERFGGRFWTAARHWYIVVMILAGFRELHWLVPAVHPFEGRRWDRKLADLDRRWFGDVDGLFLGGWPLAVVDLLHLCYWFYFSSMMIPGIVLYARKEWDRLREYACVLLLGMFVSYLGYFGVPAVGPHHFYPSRPAQLDGWLLGGPLHRALMAAEWEMPDAFPSGHTLMSLIVIAMSWRHHPPTGRWVTLPALGCVLATVALRYHYVVDVLASMALFPAVVCTGVAFHRAWTRNETRRSSSPL